MNHLIKEQYTERENLIKEAFFQNGENAQGPLDLDFLISLMKLKSRDKQYLSSLYFAGGILDHPFMLQNDSIAIGLSVLPEDAEKAGLSKKHPHQEEVIIVLNGSILLEVMELGQHQKIVLNSGDLHVIKKGQCHRIFPIDNKDAAFLFVKTNPSLEPRGEDCTFESKS